MVPPAESAPGRHYRGVLAPGKWLKAVETWVMSALQEHGQYLLDRHGKPAGPT